MVFAAAPSKGWWEAEVFQQQISCVYVRFVSSKKALGEIEVDDKGAMTRERWEILKGDFARLSADRQKSCEVISETSKNMACAIRQEEEQLLRAYKDNVSSVAERISKNVRRFNVNAVRSDADVLAVPDTPKDIGPALVACSINTRNSTDPNDILDNGATLPLKEEEIWRTRQAMMARRVAAKDLEPQDFIAMVT